eukprot:g72992.t1
MYNIVAAIAIFVLIEQTTIRLFNCKVPKVRGTSIRNNTLDTIPHKNSPKPQKPFGAQPKKNVQRLACWQDKSAMACIQPKLKTNQIFPVVPESNYFVVCLFIEKVQATCKTVADDISRPALQPLKNLNTISMLVLMLQKKYFPPQYALTSTPGPVLFESDGLSRGMEEPKDIKAEVKTNKRVLNKVAAGLATAAAVFGVCLWRFDDIFLTLVKI